MEVSGCGSFTHQQPDWSDLVTTLNKSDIKVLLSRKSGDFGGSEILSANNSRTRDFLLRLVCNRSNLVNRHIKCASEMKLQNTATGRGSPPMLSKSPKISRKYQWKRDFWMFDDDYLPGDSC